jgi:hypothetical protein
MPCSRVGALVLRLAKCALRPSRSCASANVSSVTSGATGMNVRRSTGSSRRTWRRPRRPPRARGVRGRLAVTVGNLCPAVGGLPVIGRVAEHPPHRRAIPHRLATPGAWVCEVQHHQRSAGTAMASGRGSSASGTWIFAVSPNRVRSIASQSKRRASARSRAPPAATAEPRRQRRRRESPVRRCGPSRHPAPAAATEPSATSRHDRPTALRAPPRPAGSRPAPACRIVNALAAAHIPPSADFRDRHGQRRSRAAGRPPPRSPSGCWAAQTTRLTRSLRHHAPAVQRCERERARSHARTLPESALAGARSACARTRSRGERCRDPARRTPHGSFAGGGG